MSQENVKIVRDAFAAFNRGDLDALSSTGRTTSTTGRSRVRSMTVARCTARTPCAPTCRTGSTRSTTSEVEPVELIDAGEDKVIAVVRISGRAKLSGVETDLTFAALYTIRDGKVARGREYWTKEQALEAAGLSE